MSLKENIEHFFSGYLNKKLNIEEKKEFAKILNNEDHEPELDTYYYKAWDEAETHVNKDSIHNSFSKLSEELNIKTDGHSLIKKETNRRTTLIINTLKYAAIIIIAFSIGLVSKNYIQSNSGAEEISYNVFHVPNGSKSELVLPDGTKVWVNSGSKVKYPSNYSNTNRELYLEGEAYFDVIKDSLHPFFVKTSDLLIRVLGTSFNIKSYPDEQSIETTLVTGSLEILKNNNVSENKVTLKLKPNQKANFSKETGKVTLFKQENLQDNIANNQEDLIKKQTKLAPIPTKFVEQYTAWKDEKLVLINNSFDETITKLERWYGVEIIIEKGIMGNGTFNGTFEKETLEQALDALKLATPNSFNYAIKKKIVRIYTN